MVSYIMNIVMTNSILLFVIMRRKVKLRNRALFNVDFMGANFTLFAENCLLLFLFHLFCSVTMHFFVALLYYLLHMRPVTNELACSAFTEVQVVSSFLLQ